MTTAEISTLPGFAPAVSAGAKEVTAVYCADLLSWAMGRAPEGAAWCTVMGNVNAVAVAALADVAALVLCEGANLDAEAKARAEEQRVNIITTGLPAFEAGIAIAKAAGLYG